MTDTGPQATAPANRGQRFAYGELDIDARRGELQCRYNLDGQDFVERVTMLGVDRSAWQLPGAEAAARWIFLLLGASYYKAAAPPIVDLGDLRLSTADVAFLRHYYVEGLAEFAYRNGLDLTGIDIRTPPPRTQAPLAATSAPAPARQAVRGTTRAHPAGTTGASHAGRAISLLRPLVPFGGGIDSIVTSELVRRRAGDENTALFVLSKAGDRYAAIEASAGLSGLPVVRAERELDPRILQSGRLGYLNGHVPVTGMISAIAVLAAVLHQRDAVVMSNEASASAGNLVIGNRIVNHQWSKGLAFETGFRSTLARHTIPVEYFSLLRNASELWVAQRFASLTRYHRVFHSCNRAFYVDPEIRLDRWCGVCDKCCFVDLVLAPFVSRVELEAIFQGREPLGDDALADRFRALLASSASPPPKPFDCVGDVPECRMALRLTARRADRNGGLVHRLVGELPTEPTEPTDLLQLSGPSFVPPAYALEGGAAERGNPGGGAAERGASGGGASRHGAPRARTPDPFAPDPCTPSPCAPGDLLV